jgi:hypothetical protein
MSCLSCAHHMHGGCVHPTSDRAFDDESTEACDLHHARVIKRPKPEPVPQMQMATPVYRAPITVKRPNQKPKPPQRKHRDWTEERDDHT